jgi:murein DD-endopeptidase MepM/ murein hydrolase activator NlpD
MSRSFPHVVRMCAIALAAAAPLTAPSAAADGLANARAVAVEEPFRLVLRDLRSNGNPHAMPAGRAVLENADREVIWQVADVTVATASADGSTVALLTGDYQVLVSKLPEAPRVLDGGYLIPRLSPDGSRLVAQRLGSGDHILERTEDTQGIALVDVASGEGQLILQGNDLYLPSFADDDRVFFGSGGEQQFAGLYLLDLQDMRVARVTEREGFPSNVPRLTGGTVAFEVDGETFKRPAPALADFVPVHRFDGARLDDLDVEGDSDSPDFGTVRLRRPTTQVPNPPWHKIYDYFDVGGSDYTCGHIFYSGHKGTDFPQDLGDDVVAPASGDVILRYDGCPNSDSWGCAMGWGNHVAVKHSDESVSLEIHGKLGTVVPFGYYACGVKIMETAASGNVNDLWYHTHHESWISRKAKTNKSLRYDPYQGACDPSDPSKWSAQGPYLGVPGTTCTH